MDTVRWGGVEGTWCQPSVLCVSTTTSQPPQEVQLLLLFMGGDIKAEEGDGTLPRSTSETWSSRVRVTVPMEVERGSQAEPTAGRGLEARGVSPAGGFSVAAGPGSGRVG